jgi:hypothetical protein
LLGDPATGKSQVIHQLLRQIARRKSPEAVICYDPAAEFIENHFAHEHDFVLNPLDRRFPYWSPSLEIAAIFGWSDVRMALRYTHATNEAKRRAVENLVRPVASSDESVTNEKGRVAALP